MIPPYDANGLPLAAGRPAPTANLAKLLSVVVPCHNEEATIEECHRRVLAAAQNTGWELEIVFVDDGSRDGTWTQFVRLADSNPRVVAIKLSRNFGHQLALSAGLSVCRGNAILILDCDLQDPPELLPDMLALLNNGADVVYGQRRRREGESWFKRTTASLFSIGKMLRFAGDALTAFSLRPLRWVTWCGFFSVIGSFAMAIVGAAHFLGGNEHAWVIAIIATILGLGGINLLALGAIGEYLGRLYHQSLGRPLFVIEEIRRSDRLDGNARHSPQRTSGVVEGWTG